MKKTNSGSLHLEDLVILKEEAILYGDKTLNYEGQDLEELAEACKDMVVPLLPGHTFVDINDKNSYKDKVFNFRVAMENGKKVILAEALVATDKLKEMIMKGVRGLSIGADGIMTASNGGVSYKKMKLNHVAVTDIPRSTYTRIYNSQEDIMTEDINKEVQTDLKAEIEAELKTEVTSETIAENEVIKEAEKPKPELPVDKEQVASTTTPETSSKDDIDIEATISKEVEKRFKALKDEIRAKQERIDNDLEFSTKHGLGLKYEDLTKNENALADTLKAKFDGKLKVSTKEDTKFIINNYETLAGLIQPKDDFKDRPYSVDKQKTDSNVGKNVDYSKQRNKINI